MQKIIIENKTRCTLLVGESTSQWRKLELQVGFQLLHVVDVDVGVDVDIDVDVVDIISSLFSIYFVANFISIC